MTLPPLRTRLLLVIALVGVAAFLGAASTASATAPPTGVKVDLTGCDLQAGETLPDTNGDFICQQYAQGNFGKLWSELDLVPHRVVASNANATAKTYDFIVAADEEDAGHPGYDVMSSPTGDTCTVTDGGEQHLVPGQGGADSTIYRLVHVVQPANSTCNIDYYQRLALGSHLYPGSSLHSDLLNETFGTGGVGSQELSMPVKEIAPQELSKDMAASQGTDHIWDVTKTPSPARVDLGQCTQAGTSATVAVTIEWHKQAATPNGPITVLTHVYATNPSTRTLTVNVDDDIRSGTTVLETVNGPQVDVPANTTNQLVLTHQTTVPAGTTDLNDVATGHYTDKVTGVDIPQTTTATANAAAVDQNGPELNASATVHDEETISGSDLAFTVDSVGAGSATGDFTQGTGTGGTALALPAGPFADTAAGHDDDTISWTSSQSGDGSVTFNKTISLTSDATVSGSLDDTVTVDGSDGFSTSANASIDIETEECGHVVVAKQTTPANTGSFDFTTDLPGGDFSLAGGANTGSIDVAPGQYTVDETQQAGWRFNSLSCSDQGSGPNDSSVTGTAASINVQSGETVTCTYSNRAINPAISIDKTGPANATAGDLVPYTLTVTNPGDAPLHDVVVTDAQCTTAVTLQSKNEGPKNTGAQFLDPGDTWIYTCGVQTQSGNTRVDNVGRSCALDETGRQVCDDDPASTVLAQRQVLGEQIVPGTARLAGRSGCVSRAFYATVRGNQIQSVVFRIDGKKRKTVTKPDAKGRFKYRVNPKRFKPGTHRLVAKSTFVPEAQTKSKTLKLRFARCVRRTAPAFTG